MKNTIFSLVFLVSFLFVNVNLNATNYSNELTTTVDPIKIIRYNQRLLLYSNSKIAFDLSSSDLNKSAIYELTLIAISLMQNPDLKIRIAVHNDSRSDVDYSKAITEDRASSIKDFLVNYGVNSDNLLAIGYGDTRIINKCRAFVKCTNVEHSVNKRVELVILNPEKIGDFMIYLPKKNKL